ncbi:eukaryotic mitochondrial regulator protein-domain-containing protein [Xylariaceae sp. FL0016]|nr:eukaryotic mitochondrial regulator protein-domain-containing protein [Xylariaceae sp. FL0016]
MPPRIPTSTATASAAVKYNLPLASTNSQLAASLSQSWRQPSASFSSTPTLLKVTKARRLFVQWLTRAGRSWKYPKPDGPNYITRKSGKSTDQPFPLNPQFKSEPVLDEHARELVWEKVMRGGESIKAVSAELGVDIRRVAAIVRLKEVEKDWIAKDKYLARPYSKAVLSMLPTHQIKKNQQNQPFEPINELHVHSHTMQQIFWPTSESRHFTREDAAKAFHRDMLSADDRVPHPELIQMEKEVLQGRPPWAASERFKEAVMKSERKAAEKQLAKAALDEKYTTHVPTNRCEFRFKQYNSEVVGPKGRSRHAVGWRYGAPYDDRAKGHQIKIPTSVP